MPAVMSAETRRRGGADRVGNADPYPLVTTTILPVDVEHAGRCRSVLIPRRPAAVLPTIRKYAEFLPPVPVGAALGALKDEVRVRSHLEGRRGRRVGLTEEVLDVRARRQQTVGNDL